VARRAAAGHQLASDHSRGLSLFANATMHDKKTNAIDNYVQAGVVYKGPFDARAKDDIGFALARVHVNPAYRKNARANQAAGLYDYDDPGFLPRRTPNTAPNCITACTSPTG
jgi:porin